MKTHQNSTFAQQSIIKFLNGVATTIASMGAAVLIIEYGFNLLPETLNLLHFFTYLFSGLLICQFFLKLLFFPAKKEFLKKSRGEVILICCFTAALFFLKVNLIPQEIFQPLKNTGYIISSQIFILVFIALKVSYFYRLLSSLHLSPPLTVAATFLIIIAIGTFLLLLPHSTAAGKNTSLLDAFFTAASATCVTGLIVVDTGTHFSIFGQLVILGLIQIGGLGLMMFASLFALVSGDLGIRERVILRDIVRYKNLSRIGYLVLFILTLTFIFEAIGAILLYFQFLPGEENSLRAAYSAIFHSISAFCNAGFSIYSDSFMGYERNLMVNLIMTSLIISGGLGFLVIVNLLVGISSGIKKRKAFLSLHTKLVIVTTLILIGLGGILLYAGEGNALLKGLSFKDRVLAAYFQSVTARTAGFNTINIGSLTTFSSLFLIILMFIGASPGSTGGGIKTSTFATLLLTIKSMAQGKDEVEAFKRRIPRTTIYQTLCVVTLAMGLVSISSLLLSFTENADFLNILFEVFSAFGTVGLSRGLTPHLTSWGKIIIIVTLVVGRIGPLTLALAIAGRKKVKRYEYPEEDIIIG